MTAKDVIEYFKFCKSAVETCNEALGLAVEALKSRCLLNLRGLKKEKSIIVSLAIVSVASW